ncbi:isochorismatase family protein [Marinomonas mediterranea]|uniref:isochorismatase family protein n=1 Tax=Marinomonas mediterranea TaxID=119864 RepID=UPI00234A6329|nr:isochorismatase family protein [Marinomonas mediterranea]WCN07795.1 isochorismatase family protein [Marinomonas mediterranea]
MHALILIDQQKGIDHPKLGLRNNPSAEAEISSLLSLWRQKSWPIFHVKHRSKQRESVFWPDQEGFEFKEAFLPLAIRRRDDH